MLASHGDNPGADPDKLRREFICRVLADHPFVACQIFGAIRDQAPSQGRHGGCNAGRAG
jgi:hypothetical protein